MKYILLTIVLPALLNFSWIALFLSALNGRSIWLWIAIGLILIDIMLFIWKMFKKAPTIKITGETVTVRGTKINRHDIDSWQIFEASKDGIQSRFIEFKLTKVPLSPLSWKIVKFFEELPQPRSYRRSVRLAKEPRIITTLKSWDLSKDEISKALPISDQETESAT